jgi:predicted RNase H-like HicB family nuclease
MRYPIVIHKDRKSDYGVTVPDLPGCFSAGSTLDEAIVMARQAIELHLEGMIDDGIPVPSAKSIEQHSRNPDYADGVWAVIEIDQTNLRTRAKRINITLPERVLESIDRTAASEGETRSAFLAKVAADYNKRREPVPRKRSA